MINLCKGRGQEMGNMFRREVMLYNPCPSIILILVMGTYMMKRKSACFSQEETPNASHSTGREVKRLHCEQHNWGMTAANTLSCCVSHIHTDAHTLGNTHTHTKDTFNQSWRKIVKIKTHVILGDHLLIFISNFPYKHPRQTEERDGKQVCNSRGTEVF